jgi:hypothetical protein
MSSGAVRALVVLSCRRCLVATSRVLQAYLDTTELLSRTRARLLCQDAACCKSRCSGGLVISRLSSLVPRLVGVLPDLSRLVLPRCILALHALPRAQGL